MDPCHLDNRFPNRLLAALPALVQARLAPHLKSVNFDAGDVVLDADEPIDTVYFPTTLVAAIGHRVDGHCAAAVGLTGAEGLVGIGRLLGSESSIGQASVQLAGHAYMIEAQALMQEFEQGRSMQWLLLRYVHALMSQISLNAVCERLHSIEQRLTRWLLLADDRRAAQTLALTQEGLAHLLGVRREGVALAAKQLQAASLIGYRRGMITVVDRSRLEAGACACYHEIKAEYDRFARDTE